MNDLIHRIVGIIIEAGQSDTTKFRLGETIRYSPSEIMEILKQHESEIFGVDVINLKPCPFCGGDVCLTYNSMDKAFNIWHRFNKCAMAEPMRLDDAESLADAAGKWNRRMG